MERKATFTVGTLHLFEELTHSWKGNYTKKKKIEMGKLLFHNTVWEDTDVGF